MKNATVLILTFLIYPCATKLAAQTFPYQDSTLSVDQRVDDLMSRMTLDEKIGQMMQVELDAVQSSPSILTSYFIGSVLSGGGEDPAAGNAPINWANAYDTLQTYALRAPLKIPIIYGFDAVHGANNVYGATIFPHNIGMGCTRDSELVEEEERATAEEVAATGIKWTFAPCVAIPRDERWGRTYEGFGETPELVRLLGSEAVRGFQGDSLSEPAAVLACAKHYLGDGGTTDGIDQGNTQADTPTVRKIFLPPYISAVDSGVGSIMVSFSSINGLKMSASKYWITDVLKGELGFKGIVISDWAAIDQLTSNYQDCVEQSINAGMDMVMLPSRYGDFQTAMRNLVSGGEIDTARVDDAVRRILTIKFRLGLFERPFSDRSLMPSVGDSTHRAIARQCVQESMVLLKKKDGILPLRKANAKILVAGSNADNLGNQCGGWTISWQGVSGTYTVGTTILQGMTEVAPNAQIEYSQTGNFSDTTSDYSVVIIGESPYAETYGDVPAYRSLNISQSDINLIQKMKNHGAPLILILVSGRPLILAPVLHYCDAIFAAWLPGTEGEGVADVLLGDAPPHGVLSRTWPENMAQIPINFGDTLYHPLYPYGFGITSFADSPFGSSPVALSSIVTADGSHLELTFNKRMKDPSSTQSTFVLLRNGVPVSTSASLSLKQSDSTTIILGLDSVYYSKSDTAMLSYVSGTIESSDGGILRPFDSLTAYNWSTSISAVRGRNSVPLTNELAQNYPNPFNPTTNISFSLAARSNVTLKVFDILGREVATLVSEELPAGTHTFQWNALNLSSGVYFYRLQTGSFTQTKKLILLR